MDIKEFQCYIEDHIQSSFKILSRVRVDLYHREVRVSIHPAEGFNFLCEIHKYLNDDSRREKFLGQYKDVMLLRFDVGYFKFC